MKAEVQPSVHLIVTAAFSGLRLTALQKKSIWSRLTALTLKISQKSKTKLNRANAREKTTVIHLSYIRIPDKPCLIIGVSDDLDTLLLNITAEYK